MRGKQNEKEKGGENTKPPTPFPFKKGLNPHCVKSNNKSDKVVLVNFMCHGNKAKDINQ